MAFWDNVATKRAQKNDPVAPLKPRNQPGSNQVKFKENAPYPLSTPSVGDAKVGANTQGTGKVGISTTMALASKRRLGIKLPANF